MKFIVTGDALFSSSHVDKTMDPNLLALLKEADEVFTNAEFVTPRRNTAPAAGRGYQTSVRPKTLDEFARLNIRYVGFANNHTGITASKDLPIQLLKRNNVAWFLWELG